MEKGDGIVRRWFFKSMDWWLACFCVVQNGGRDMNNEQTQAASEMRALHK